MDEDVRKRKPGRPKGSGDQQKTDLPLLDQVADRKVTAPSVKTAVIIKQVLVSNNTKNQKAGLRRLQGKFKANEAVLVAEAEARLRARKEAERLAAFKENLVSAGLIIQGVNSRIEAFARSKEGQEAWEKVTASMERLGSELMNSPLRPWLELLALANGFRSSARPGSVQPMLRTP